MVLQEILRGQMFSILQFLLVIIIGYVITKLITDFLGNSLRKEETKKMFKEMGYEEPIIDLILMAVRYVLYLLTFIAAIAQFGFPTIVFDVVIIIIALFAAALVIYSLKDFIPNATAGIYLARVKSVKKGEKVKIGLYSGEVIEMTLLTTTLRDESGRLTIIPNANLTKKEIVKEAAEKKGK
jgi:small-conductance mechanosensitive channel